MKPIIFSRWMTLPLLALLTVISCGLPVSAIPSPEQSQPTATEKIQTEPESTATIKSATTATAGVVQETISASPASSCTVVQDLSLRSGPGTAYRPRIRVLPANTVVTPLGFASQGLVGGSWAYVQVPVAQDKGWVSAGPQFISCDVDLASLPPVAFGTPQPYVPSTSQVSPGPGTCGEGGIFSESTDDVYDCSVKFSAGFPVQFIILKNGREAGGADGVQNVSFSVVQNGITIYSHTENTEAYCLFGGNAPCNSWVFEDYVYKWEAGGAVLESGNYTLKIFPALEDSSINLFWSADITMNVPR